jgi:hypothetical protein
MQPDQKHMWLQGVNLRMFCKLAKLAHACKSLAERTQGLLEHFREFRNML